MTRNLDSSIPRIAPFLMVSKTSFVFLFLNDQGDRCARVIDNVTCYLPREQDFLSWNGLSAQHFRRAVSRLDTGMGRGLRAVAYDPCAVERTGAVDAPAANCTPLLCLVIQRALDRDAARAWTAHALGASVLVFSWSQPIGEATSSFSC